MGRIPSTKYWLPQKRFGLLGEGGEPRCTHLLQTARPLSHCHAGVRLRSANSVLINTIIISQMASCSTRRSLQTRMHLCPPRATLVLSSPGAHRAPSPSRRSACLRLMSFSASSTSTTCARGCPSSSGGRERFGSIAKVRLPHNHKSVWSYYTR